MVDDPELTDINEELESQLQAWRQICASNLSLARDARKKAENDAQILANRISLLKDAESKALKTIEQTRKRTDEVTVARQQQEESFRKVAEARRATKEQEDARRRHVAWVRARSQSVKKDAMQAMESKRKEAAESVRFSVSRPASQEHRERLRSGPNTPRSSISVRSTTPRSSMRASLSGPNTPRSSVRANLDGSYTDRQQTQQPTPRSMPSGDMTDRSLTERQYTPRAVRPREEGERSYAERPRVSNRPSLHNEVDRSSTERTRVSKRPSLSDSVADAGSGMEREERQLLGRLRFAAAAAGRPPPRPELEDASRTERLSPEAGNDVCLSARQRMQIAELASGRGNFSSSFGDDSEVGPLTPPWTLDLATPRSPKSPGPRSPRMSTSLR